MKITYGADPELMLIDVQEERVVSSIPILKRDKYNPIKLGSNAQMYCDNVLIEFAFKPCTSKTHFLNRLQNTFQIAQTLLGDRIRIFPKIVHEFDDIQLQKEYNIDPKEIGCNPSHNAYTLEVNEAIPFDSGIRTGSFHIHLGSEKLRDVRTKISIVRLLDIFVGCSSIIFTKDETAKYRRKYYGRAGEFRYTPYGIEYRVLDNFALLSPKLTELVMDLTNYVLKIIEEEKQKIIFDLIDIAQVIEAINTFNSKLAEEILIKVKLPKHLMNRIKNIYKIDFYNDWNL